MVDFLRSNTWCGKEEYMWEMTVGQVRLASVDFSHVEYKRDAEKNGKKKKKKVKGADDLKNDLGVAIGKKG